MAGSTQLELGKLYEAYDVGYQVFLANWQVNRQIALDLMQKYLKPYPPQVSVLSVGAGPGDFDVQVIRSLKQQLPREITLRYIAIEPNPLHRQRYEQRINISEFADVELKVYSEKIEELQLDEKFDIIHFTHSMYHMPNLEKHLIQKTLGMLKDDGFVIITLDTTDAVIYDTIVRYAALTGQGITEMPWMSTIQTIVAEMGLSSELVNYPEYMDVRVCFEENTAEGKALIDFFCQADSSLLSRDQRDEILQILASHITEQNGRKLVPADAATMIIPKQIANNN
ncbi:methyltransferase domain-containing protein [Nostoc linckia FACHB-104]|nr:methyltransferase domain-containing protein [Nostoc linckia FACHB-104]